MYIFIASNFFYSSATSFKHLMCYLQYCFTVVEEFHISIWEKYTSKYFKNVRSNINCYSNVIKKLIGQIKLVSHQKLKGIKWCGEKKGNEELHRPMEG